RSDRVAEQGVRPACLLPRAPRDRALAREAPRPRLGNDLPRRHPHRRRARRSAAAQARRSGLDPYGAGRRIQAHVVVTSLRARLLQAVGLTVVLCVGLTIAVGLVLTLRAVDDATLKDVEHQAALIAARERSAVSAYTDLEPMKPLFAQQHERALPTPDITFLPEPAQVRLLRGRPASGSVTVDGHAYFFAAEPRIQGKFFVLLRPKSVTKSQWKPFAYGLLIAALAG